MEGLFKTAVGGFKKEDVLAYIDKQESDFRSKEADYKKQLRQSADKLAQEQEAGRQQQAKAAELSDSLEMVARKNSELEKQLAEAREQTGQAAAETESARAEAEQLRQEIRRLQMEQSRRADELKEKDAAIERLKAAGSRSEQSQDRISRVLVEAQATADRIVGNAGQKAADILSRARTECAALAETAAAFRRDVASLRSEIGGAAGRLDGTLLTMEDAAEKFRTTYTHAFDGGEDAGPEEKAPAPEEPSPEQAPADGPEDASAARGAFDFSAFHPQG